MRGYLLYLALSAFFICDVNADTRGGSRSKKRLIELADSSFFAEDFSTALKLYDEVLESSPSNHYAKYHRYIAYHLSHGRGTAIDEIYEFEKNEGHEDKFYNYWMGRIHFERYEFDVAKRHFMAFLNIKSFRSKEIKKEVEWYLRKINKVKSYHDTPVDYQIVPLDVPINSIHADVSPAFFGDHQELLFVSSRPNEGGEQVSINSDFNVYHAFKENGEWREPTVLSSLGNFSKENTKIEVDQQGNLFMFMEGENGGLYHSEPEGRNWKAPLKFDAKVNGKSMDGDFFINDNKDIIYFSSKTSGYKLDIYESRYDHENEIWSHPRQVPGALNSRYDEDSPFLSPDGQYLYFSSNRQTSIGGFDVFRSRYDEASQSWSEPEQLGFPINTIDDEVNFQLNSDNISGFFSSNRLHSKGDFDIYYFHKPGKVMASGTVRDKNSGLPIANARVEFHPIEYKDGYFHTTTDADGRFGLEVFENEEFLVQLSLKEQLLLVHKVMSVPGELHKTFSTDFEVDMPSEGGTKVDFNTLYEGDTDQEEYTEIDMLGNKFRAGQKAVIRNIYFDSDSYQLTEGYRDILNQIYGVLSGSPDLRIEISGHTDNVEMPEASLQISLQRAQSIKKELVQMGVTADRLVTVGHGDTRPLASNDDEENGRELNRRIEVRVLD